MARLVVTNANLIDAVTPGVRAGCSVTVEDERIVEVLDGRRSPATHGAEVIDLRGAYLLPGLWDAHVHLEWPRIAQAGVPELTAQYLANAQRALLEAGVTGMRMAGAPHFIDVALKRAFDSGQHVGPRLYTCGWFLTTTAGHALGTGFALPCDGPDGFVRTIREHIQAGVDHIKLNLTGGIMGPAWDRHWHSFFTESELQAAFAICHQRGLKVMAHAASAGAVKAALRLGAHSVEHGYIMDDECLALFREHDAWYVPTLGITHLTPGQATTRWEKQWVEQRGLSPDLVKRAEDAVDEHRAWFRRALAAGLKMAVGSDVRPVRDGALLELGLWVKSGATPWQTLQAATRHAADICGVGHDLGTIEVGKLADLIVVRDNPLDDIDNVRTLQLVFKGGRLVADHRGGSSPLTAIAVLDARVEPCRPAHDESALVCPTALTDWMQTKRRWRLHSGDTASSAGATARDRALLETAAVVESNPIAIGRGTGADRPQKGERDAAPVGGELDHAGIAGRVRRRGRRRKVEGGGRGGRGVHRDRARAGTGAGARPSGKARAEGRGSGERQQRAGHDGLRARGAAADTGWSAGDRARAKARLRHQKRHGSRIRGERGRHRGGGVDGHRARAGARAGAAPASEGGAGGSGSGEGHGRAGRDGLRAGGAAVDSGGSAGDRA